MSPPRRYFAAFLLGIVWLLLAREPASAAVGAVAVAAALWTLRRTAAASGARPRLARLPRFAAVFVRDSLRGGVDVARRIGSRDMRLQPGFVTLRLALPDEGARVLLAVVVSLMPGTLAARLQADELTLHALDLRLPIEAETRRLEREVARLYGLERLTPESPG